MLLSHKYPQLECTRARAIYHTIDGVWFLRSAPAEDYKQLAKQFFCWQKFIFNLASVLKKITSWKILYSKAYLNL